MSNRRNLHIIKRMIDLDISVVELEQRTGIHRDKISRLRVGRQEPKYADAIAIAQALECDPGELWPDLITNNVSAG